MISSIEFALSEFAAFEFAHELGSVVQSSEFTFEGSSSVLISGVAKHNSAFLVQGAKATGEFHGQAVTSTQAALTKGEAIVAFFGASMRSADFAILTDSDAYFNVGYYGDARIGMRGTSDFDARSVDPETLDIHGRAIVTFLTGIKQVADIQIRGETKVAFPAYFYGNARIVASGNPVVTFNGASFAYSSYWGDSKGTVALKPMAYSMGELTSEAAAAVSIQGQRVTFTVVSGAGKTSNNFSAYGLGNGQFSIAGSTTLNTPTQLIRDYVFKSDGAVEVVFRPGSPVIKNMPYAWDVLIRPYEVREVFWK